ncbi:MAG: hypothetical protein OEV42_12810 [Deltaproteobacteria bacterium]|nr:hypothetical protein [Deltaproteobacteria bacterium]
MSGKYISVRSRLDFEDIHSNMAIAGAKIRIDKSLYLNLSYGSGKIDKAHVRDSDWISVPADGVHNLQFSESLSEGRGGASIFEAGGEYRVGLPGRRFSFSLYAGYLYYEESLKMKRGVQTLSDPTYFPMPPVGYTMSDLNSTYDFYWYIFKTGVQWRIKSGRKIEFDGGFYFLHTLKYYGEAYWNLRVGEFRAKKPNFIHEADDGLGLEAFINVRFLMSRRASITAGYRHFYLEAQYGTSTTYYADGSKGKASLDIVESERQGPYVRLEVKF